jgi:hypothetical protein
MLNLEDIGSSLKSELDTTLLPSDFPASATPPRFGEGEKVCWKPLDGDEVDFGIVIGHFYAHATHLASWGWKYLVFLDRTSQSRAFCLADTAWEDHLESMSDRNCHE